jgi:hypothetical protein
MAGSTHSDRKLAQQPSQERIIPASGAVQSPPAHQLLLLGPQAVNDCCDCSLPQVIRSCQNGIWKGGPHSDAHLAYISSSPCVSCDSWDALLHILSRLLCACWIPGYELEDDAADLRPSKGSMCPTFCVSHLTDDLGNSSLSPARLPCVLARRSMTNREARDHTHRQGPSGKSGILPCHGGKPYGCFCWMNRRSSAFLVSL